MVVGSRYFSGGEQFGKVPVGRWEPSATCWHLVNSSRGRASQGSEAPVTTRAANVAAFPSLTPQKTPRSERLVMNE